MAAAINPCPQLLRTIMENLKTLIDNETDLRRLMSRAKQSDAVGLDTEFVWERTYYPQLGLIQLSLSDEECYLIDPLAITDLAPLGELLAHRGVTKILHDAPQDLMILRQATGAEPQNIFDTRLAAGFCNLPATLSLGNLIKELLDIELAKEETRTNWCQRPLTEEQVRYAIDDVRYLRAIRVLLLSRIIGPKIRSWLQEELNLLNNPATYAPVAADERWLRLRGANGLDRAGLAILKNLCTWREGMAKKLNRPRNHVLKDTQLIDLARNRPVAEEQQKAQAGLSEKAVSRYGKIITTIIENTLKQPPDSYPEVERPLRLSPSDRHVYEKLSKLIELKAGVLGIAPGLIGNTGELKLLVSALNDKKSTIPRQLRQTEGWRKSFLEDFFRHHGQS